MHSALVRFQNVFGFFTTVAFCTAIFVALTPLFSPQTPSANIELRNVQVVKGRPHYYSSKKEEYAVIKFDLDADFSSLFNWNTKQLFVWITATYPSKSSTTPNSQAVIWDKIIESESALHPLNPILSVQKLWKARKSTKKPKPKPKSTLKPLKGSAAANATASGIVKLQNSKPKYQITDISGTLAGRQNVTLEVGWNVQPWVGALTWTMPEGRGFGIWKGVRSGRSRMFTLPDLKGKPVVKGTVVGKAPVKESAEAMPFLG